MDLKKITFNMSFIIMIFMGSITVIFSQPGHHRIPGSFQLTGAHRAIECTACHTSPEPFVSVSRNCESCHLKTFLTLSNPSHTEHFYSPSQCSNCHTTGAWTPHISVHDPGDDRCVACHTTSLADANQEVMGHETLANDCTLCHVPSRWNVLVYDHSQTGYSLREDQTGLACTTCHPSGFLGETVDCPSCNSKEGQTK